MEVVMIYKYMVGVVREIVEEEICRHMVVVVGSCKHTVEDMKEIEEVVNCKHMEKKVKGMKVVVSCIRKVEEKRVMETEETYRYKTVVVMKMVEVKIYSNTMMVMKMAEVRAYSNIEVVQNNMVTVVHDFVMLDSNCLVCLHKQQHCKQLCKIQLHR